MTLILELAPEVEARLHQRAAILGVTVSDLVTMAVKEGIADDDKSKGTSGEYTLRLAAELRAAIPAEELARVPTDWATNPDKYRFAHAADNVVRVANVP